LPGLITTDTRRSTKNEVFRDYFRRLSRNNALNTYLSEGFTLAILPANSSSINTIGQRATIESRSRWGAFKPIGNPFLNDQTMSGWDFSAKILERIWLTILPVGPCDVSAWIRLAGK